MGDTIVFFLFVLFFVFFMRVCSKPDVFVCKARFCLSQPEEAGSDKGAEKANKLTPEQVTQMFGPRFCSTLAQPRLNNWHSVYLRIHFFYFNQR